ncbi:MAG: hypothetical protein VX546_15355 [Myxococcota bacterium]|nr:hypothetical protein [Myxococcota bacterium]
MPGAGPVSRPLELLPWAGLLALAACLGLNQISSFDYWWMLRTGQLIAETGAVPRVDPYTYSVPGARWIDIHWLHQLGLWGLYRLGGHTAAGAWQFVAMLLVLALVAPIGRRPGRSWLSVAALALMLLNGADRFSPRPESSSFVLLAGVLALLDRFERRGDARVYAIVLLQVIWVNLHGLFALGVALCGIQLVAELLRKWGGDPKARERGRVWRIAAVTVLAAAAALANPNGLEAALYPLEQLSMIGPSESRAAYGVLELQPSLGSLPPVKLFFFLAIAGLSAAALALNWRRARLADLLTWIAFLYLAIGANRNVAIFGIVAAPILVRNANAWLDTRPAAPRLARAASLVVFALLLVPAWDAARGEFYPRQGLLKRPGFGATPWFTPGPAVDWIEANNPPGPIAHPMKMGGYLVWRLYPERKVLVDGRLEVYGADRLRQLLIHDDKDFTRLDGEYGFGTAIVRFTAEAKSGPLLAWLGESPDWQLVYLDDFDAVFVRTTAGFPPLDLDAAGRFERLDGSQGWFDELRLRNRTHFLVSAGRPDLALATWDQLLAAFPDAQNGRRIRDWLASQARR